MLAADAQRRNSASEEEQLDFENLHLHGRDSQTSELYDAYERSSASCQVVWISGRAGVGKSTLVESSFQNRDTFCSGKFEALCAAQPYEAIVNLLSGLCCILEVDYPSIKLQLDDVEILSRLVPEIRRVVDCGEAESSTTEIVYKPEWGFEKLKHAVRSFVNGACETISSFASASLIIFLDDLQWADVDSLDIIKSLLVDTNMKGMLFIGSYRDNEVLYSSPLTHCMHAVQAKFVSPCDSITLLQLPDLDKASIDLLVSNLTRLPLELAQPLSDLVYPKTGGNCFFTLEMLRHLVGNDILFYSSSSFQWEWDTEKIRLEIDVSDNVVEFMAKRMRMLSTEATDALKLAACLGSRVDTKLLESLSTLFSPSVDLPPMVEILREASQQHLIEFNSDQSRFKFSHDRILSAAYALIPFGSQKQIYHLRIGQYLLETYIKDHEQQGGKSMKSWYSILAVDQLNRGRDLITDEKEQVEMARLNLLSAEQVIKTSAFKMAATFLKSGIAFLGLDGWSRHYELSLNLNNELVSVLFSNGLMDDTLELVNHIYGRAKCVEDRRKAQFVHIEVLASLHQLPECISLGLQILRDMGHPKIPRKPGLRHIIPSIIGVQKLLKGRSDDELLSLPTCGDPKLLAMMRNLGFLSPVSFFANEDALIPILTCRMMQISLKHGISEASPYAFASYGFTLTVTGDFAGAYRFAMLALRLMERFHEDSRTLVMVYGLLYHLRNPIVDSNAHTLRAYHVAFSQGDLIFAGQACSMHAVSRLVAGLALDNIVDDIFGFGEQLQAYNQILMWKGMLCLQRSLLELVDRPHDVTRLKAGPILDDEAIEEYFYKSNSNMILFSFWMYTHWTRFYLGDLKSALMYAEKCWASPDLKGALVYAIPYFLLSALTALDTWKTTRKLRYWRIFRKNHRELIKWVKLGNPNTIHVVTMLDAEVLAVRRSSKPDEVRSAYDKAIALASRGGFVQDAALANERVGDYFLNSRKDAYWGNHYLIRSIDLYDVWGAAAKVKQMGIKYGKTVRNDSNEFGSIANQPSTAVKGKSQIKAIALVEETRNLPLLSMETSNHQEKPVSAFSR